MSRSTVVVLGFDVLVVVTFVIFGRDTHDSPFDIAESTRIAAPFMAGLGIGWLIPQVRASAWRVLNGVIVGLITVVVGVTLRSVVFGDGITGAFPAVAAAYLIGMMSVYRVALAVRSRQRA